MDDPEAFKKALAELPAKERRRLVRYVNRGQAPEGKKDAAMAVGLARQQQRFWGKVWWFAPLVAVLTITQGWVAFVVNAVTATLIVGGMSWFWLRRARRAEAAALEIARPGRHRTHPKERNADRADDGDADEDSDAPPIYRTFKPPRPGAGKRKPSRRERKRGKG